ncbi:MAG: pirin family protein [Brachymonas sp.]
MKTVLSVQAAPARHWVGDGFPVHGMFGYNGAGVAERSPFLLLDYAPPYPFTPNSGTRRGVGQHPHRGFETVTIVYSGELEHRDSTGAGGIIGAGDVQWMTAGGGIIHEEFHAPAFSQSGGVFEVAQLWVNLPAKDKMTPAHYQGITAAQIPTVALPHNAGHMRLIAGDWGEGHAPAQTYTPMRVWDVRLAAGAQVDLPQPEGWHTLVLVLQGEVGINGAASLGAAQVATLSAKGTGLHLHNSGSQEAKILLLAGEPIDEPVFGYGPFVMNSREEIVQAVEDFNSGRMGRHEDTSTLHKDAP